MRKPFHNQKSLFIQTTSHKYSKELQVIADMLKGHPEFVEWVHRDLCAGKKDTGSCGIAAEQVFRAAILKQQNTWTYDFLALQCVDSEMTRAFLGLDFGQSIGRSTLQENIAKISAETWQKINNALVLDAEDKGIENGRTIRVDSTVIASNIHHPTDSSLLYDCVRVICDEVKKINRKYGRSFSCNISTKEAKRLALRILNSKGPEKRLAVYKNFLKKTRQLLVRLRKWLKILAGDRDSAVKLEAIEPLFNSIIDQTHRRVIKGEKLPPDEKIVSIFEPHTDIIIKGQREVEYGHKAFFTSGKSGLVLDCQLVQSNPADSEYFLDIIETQKRVFGRVPRQITADGGFASEDNCYDAKELGVKDVCFSKPCGLGIEEMCKSAWVFQKLRNFRAGIEALISTLKRSFGLDKVTWRGVNHFAKYVHSSICAYNLTIMARRIIETE